MPITPNINAEKIQGNLTGVTSINSSNISATTITSLTAKTNILSATSLTTNSISFFGDILSSGSTTRVIGTTDASALTFQTNNTTRGIFNATGAGFIIGTSVPSIAPSFGINIPTRISNNWLGTGIALVQAACTYTDTTTTGGTIAKIYGDYFGVKTFAATSAITYNEIYGTYFDLPVTGSNVTANTIYTLGINGDFLTESNTKDAKITVKTSSSTNKSLISLENNVSAYAQVNCYGSNFSIVEYRNNGVFGAKNSWYILSDGSVSSGGTNSLYFMTGGYTPATQTRLIISNSSASFYVPVSATTISAVTYITTPKIKAVSNSLILGDNNSDNIYLGNNNHAFTNVVMYAASNASGYSITRVTATNTLPNFVINRVDTTTGIGGNINTVALITSGVTRLIASNNGISATSITATSAVFSSLTNTALSVYGSGTTNPIFTVQGSQGELFSVSDNLQGSLFSVNDISGLPILEAFSDNTVLMGSYQAPALNTTVKISLSAGNNTIYSIPTSAYTGAFVDYTLMNSGGARAGNIMSIWSGTSAQYSETYTNNIGNSTSNISFNIGVSGNYAVLSSSATTSGTTVKCIIRSI